MTCAVTAKKCLPLGVLLPGEAEIRFVDQRSSLKRVAVTFPLHVGVGDASQLVVDQRRQSFECRLISLPPIKQQFGYSG
jgi:hypothetical protein